MDNKRFSIPFQKIFNYAYDINIKYINKIIFWGQVFWGILLFLPVPGPGWTLFQEKWRGNYINNMGTKNDTCPEDTQ